MKNWKLNEVKGDLGKFLKLDPGLSSNLLVLALKEELEERLETARANLLEGFIKDICSEIMPGDESCRSEFIKKVLSRIDGLKTWSNDDYTVLLPADKWEEGRIPVDGDLEIAPTDLTVVPRREVWFDWESETGCQNGKQLVFDESWVGQEVPYLPWGERLFSGISNGLLRPNGWEIPSDGDLQKIRRAAIVAAWDKQYGDDKRIGPLLRKLKKEGLSKGSRHAETIHSIIEACDEDPSKDIVETLREKFNLAGYGIVYEGKLDTSDGGGYWSTDYYRRDEIYTLEINEDYAYKYNDKNYGVPPYAMSIRCVRGSDEE